MSKRSTVTKLLETDSVDALNTCLYNLCSICIYDIHLIMFRHCERIRFFSTLCYPSKSSTFFKPYFLNGPGKMLLIILLIRINYFVFLGAPEQREYYSPTAPG